MTSKNPHCLHYLGHLLAITTDAILDAGFPSRFEFYRIPIKPRTPIVFPLISIPKLKRRGTRHMKFINLSTKGGSFSMILYPTLNGENMRF